VTLGNVLTVASLLITLVTGYVNLKLDVQASSAQIERVQTQVKQLDADNLPTRITVLESSIGQSQASDERQRADTNARLDRLQDAVTTLSNAVAGLTATLRAQEARR
jgi:hypothetical protein